MTNLKADPLFESFADTIIPFLENIDNSSKAELINCFWHEHAVPYFVEIQHLKDSIDREETSLDDIAAKSILLTKKVLQEGGKLESELNDEELIKNVKNLFRIVGAPFGLSSKAVKHALEKPGGYPGDHELLEFIYNNKPVSEKAGYCADKVFLQDDYAVAVRSRKDWMKEYLKNYLHSHSEKSANIFNIACGGSRELRELFAENTFIFKQPVTFDMIDKSEEALCFSKNHLSDVPENIFFNYHQNSVYDYLKEPQLYSEKFSGQDLIYSIGLADYIPADALRDQIKFFFDLLTPGGQLIIAHKDSKNYIPLNPDWWADWTFHLRNEEEVVSLVKTSGIDNYTLTVEREDTTNIIFFLNIKKG